MTEGPDQARLAGASRTLNMVGAIAAFIAVLALAALVWWFALRAPRF
jgi:hypothetical protein